LELIRLIRTKLQSTPIKVPYSDMLWQYAFYHQLRNQA
jgi:hypothetical protein